MRKSLLVFALALMVKIGQAQDEKKYTLQECINIALENNLRVKKTVYGVQNSETFLLQSKAAFLPSINAGGAYGLNYGRALNPVTNSFVDRNSNTINVQGTSSWTLFNGLRIQNTFRQSQKDVQASNQDLAKAKNDVVLNVITFYITVIFNKELYENANYQLNSSEQQLDRIKKQVAAGALSISSQLNQEALVATNEVNLVNQENALNLSILQLKQAMQLPASMLFDIEIPELQPEDLILSQSAEDIYKIALEAMPEIKSAKLKVESAEFSLRANKGNYYPRLTLNAAAQSNYSSLSNIPRYKIIDGFTKDTSRPVAMTASDEFVYQLSPNTEKISDSYNQMSQIKDNLYKSLSLQLTVPIFNGLQTRTNVQRAVISKELANIAVQETENSLRQAVETAYNDAVAASKTYHSSLKQVAAQQEAYRMNKQRFELGAISFVEYQVSENDLFRAKTDLTRAKYNFIFKIKVLDFYQGKEIEF